MLRGYYEQLLAYKLMLKYGDREMISKVDQMIDAYELAVVRKEDLVKNWNFRIAEQDEEKPRTYQKSVLEYEDGEIHKTIEILSDFSFSDSLYLHTLPTHTDSVLVYYEYPPRKFLSDATKYELIVVRTGDIKKPTIITKGGKLLRGMTVKRVVENASTEPAAEKE